MLPTRGEKELYAALYQAGFTFTPAPANFHWSALVQIKGDHQAAENAYRKLVDKEPTNRNGLEGLAFLLQKKGAYQEAIPFRRRVCELEAKDLGLEGNSEVVEYLLARYGIGEMPEKMPNELVTAKFDTWAQRLEEMYDTIQYTGPKFLMEAVLGEARQTEGISTLDIGCGTGLVGLLAREVSETLDGLDLSPKIIEEARKKGVYDNLYCGDLVEVLPGLKTRYQMVLSGDVFCYLGDLESVFEVVRPIVEPGGLFGFTTEAGENSDYELRPSGRYKHSPKYILRLAEENGFEKLVLQQRSYRVESGVPLDGLVVVLRRTES